MCISAILYENMSKGKRRQLSQKNQLSLYCHDEAQIVPSLLSEMWALSTVTCCPQYSIQCFVKNKSGVVYRGNLQDSQVYYSFVVTLKCISALFLVTSSWICPSLIDSAWASVQTTALVNLPILHYFINEGQVSVTCISIFLSIDWRNRSELSAVKISFNIRVDLSHRHFCLLLVLAICWVLDQQ